MGKSRKQVHDSYITNGGTTNYSKVKSDGTETPLIGNVNTDSGKTNYATNPPPSPGNLRYKSNIDTLNYFKSLDSKNFKYGLEMGNVDNLDEDPVIFGFDLVINTMTSPLYSARSPKSEFTGDLEGFFNFGVENGIDEITNRRPIYEEFMSNMEKIFLTTNTGSFDTFKAHYLKSIEGLDKLVNTNTSSVTKGKQFTKFGEDKITLNIMEDSSLNGGLIAMLYNTMSYNKLRGKVIIPDNLLRFDCSIIISEIRNYNSVRETIDSGDDLNKSIKIFNDNVSRYVYNLYDCQFMFDNMSHESNIHNDKIDISDTWKMSFLYKFASLSMEKFTLNTNDINNKQSQIFLNNASVDPTKTLTGELSSSDSGGGGSDDVFGYGYTSRSNPYKDLNKVTSNGVIYGESISYDTERNQMGDLERNSQIAKKDGTKQREEETKKESKLDPNNNPLKPLSEGGDNVNNGTTTSIDKSDLNPISTSSTSLNDNKTTSIDKSDLNPISTSSTSLNDNKTTSIDKSDLNPISDSNTLNVNQAFIEDKTTIGSILKGTGQLAIQKIKTARDNLINDTIQRVRTATGLRRISSPINVYYDNNSIPGFLRNGLRDFTNERVTNLLGRL